MDVNFKYNEPEANEPVRIEQVFAEKPAGGMIKAPAFDILPTTAVSENADGSFSPIKAYRLVKANASADSTIEIAKGSGIATSDFLGYGKKAVKVTSVNKNAADKDVVTIQMGVDIPAGAVLYQAKAASADAAEPIAKPKYVTGNFVAGGEGDKAVRLINGANLRKETACVGEDIAALMPTITLV